MQFKIILVNSGYVLVEIKRGKRGTACQKKLWGSKFYYLSNFFFLHLFPFKYSILLLIEPLVNRVKLVIRVTWQKTEPYSVNLFRLIGPTHLFRSIGSKWPGLDVILISEVYCIY